jgi:hypothetical protein
MGLSYLLMKSFRQLCCTIYQLTCPVGRNFYLSLSVRWPFIIINIFARPLNIWIESLSLPTRLIYSCILLSWALKRRLGGWIFRPLKRVIELCRAHEEYQHARCCVYGSKSRTKTIHDGNCVADHLYEVGQYVWFNIKKISLRHDSQRHKLLSKFWDCFG